MQRKSNIDDLLGEDKSVSQPSTRNSSRNNSFAVKTENTSEEIFVNTSTMKINNLLNSTPNTPIKLVDPTPTTPRKKLGSNSYNNNQSDSPKKRNSEQLCRADNDEKCSTPSKKHKIYTSNPKLIISLFSDVVSEKPNDGRRNGIPENLFPQQLVENAKNRQANLIAEVATKRRRAFDFNVDQGPLKETLQILKTKEYYKKLLKNLELYFFNKKIEENVKLRKQGKSVPLHFNRKNK